MTCGRHIRRALALFCAAAALAHARTTLATGPGGDVSPSYQLLWVRDPGAEGCASSIELSKSLDSLLGGGRRVGDTGGAFRVEGRVSAAAPGSGYRIQLRVLDHQGNTLGERELATQSEACSALTSRVLLVLAMILDAERSPNTLSPTVGTVGTEGRAHSVEGPDSASRAGEDATRLSSQDTSNESQESATGGRVRKEANADGPLVDSSPSAASDAASPGAAREPTRYEAFVGLALTSGLVPQGSAGVGLVARALAGQRWSFALAGVAFWPGTAATPRAGVGIGAAHGAIDVCRKVLDQGSLSLAACAGGFAGARWFHPEALARASASAGIRRYFGPEAGLDLSVGLKQAYSLQLGVRLIVEAIRERFVYQDAAGETLELFKPSLFSAYGFAGLGVRL